MKRYHGVYGAMCATKAGRENMAQQVTDLVTPLGWEISINPGYLDPLEVRIEMKRGGYVVSTHFIGRSRVGAFLAHWHTDVYSEARYPRSFPSNSINECHFRKATTCEENWRPFLAKLKEGMECLNALLTEKAP